MTLKDDQFAQLLSIFENATDQEIQAALEKSNGDLQGAIDLMLSCVDTNSKKRKADDGDSNAFTRLMCPKTRIPIKSRLQLSQDDVANHLPCGLFPSFLPDALAESLLVKLMVQSKDWRVRSFSLFGRGVCSF